MSYTADRATHLPGYGGSTGLGLHCLCRQPLFLLSHLSLDLLYPSSFGSSIIGFSAMLAPSVGHAMSFTAPFMAIMTVSSLACATASALSAGLLIRSSLSAPLLTSFQSMQPTWPFYKTGLDHNSSIERSTTALMLQTGSQKPMKHGTDLLRELNPTLRCGRHQTCGSKTAYVKPVYTNKIKPPDLVLVKRVVGGDKIDYSGGTAAYTADLKTVKLLWNAVVSTLGAKLMTIDVKNLLPSASVTYYASDMILRIPVRANRRLSPQWPRIPRIRGCRGPPASERSSPLSLLQIRSRSQLGL